MPNGSDILTVLLLPRAQCALCRLPSSVVPLIKMSDAVGSACCRKSAPEAISNARKPQLNGS